MKEEFFYHLASPPGEGGLAVFELYGPGAGPAIRTGLGGKELPGEGRTRLGVLFDENSEKLDEVVVGRQPASSMWCGLDVFTLSIHGGSWLQERTAGLLDSLGGVGLKLREVLELAVREEALDAIRACAFECLVDSRTERAAGFFSRQHSGELSEIISRCIELAGRDDGSSHSELERTLRALLEAAPRALRLAKPLKLLIAGRANTGKSTLFNRFMESERVAVSSQAGTTRDFIRGTAAVFDYPVDLADSVGLRRRPEDPVEEEALDWLAQEAADGCLYLLEPPWKLEEEDRSFLQGRPEEAVLVVGNKLDKAAGRSSGDADLLICALHGDGFEKLQETIAGRWLGGVQGLSMSEDPGPSAPFTPLQAEILEQALSALVKTPSTPLLDEVKSCLIICLKSSWPQKCAPAS
ncbi:MAG: GTPase [Planctomycetota bacterium]